MQSPPTRRIAGFALRFGLLFGLLVAGWSVLRPAYRPLFCTLGNLCFEGGEASARFQASDTPDELDILIRLAKRGPPPVTASMRSSSRLTGYMPTVSLVALILASPISWKRRRRALLFGLLLVTLFVALRMGIPIRNNFSNPDALQVYERGDFARWAFGIADRALVSAPASFFVVPVLIWIGVAFRRQDWDLVRK